MTHWRSSTFWASAVFGWLVTMIVLAFFISMFGADQMTDAEGVVILVCEQVLSLIAGYEYGRRQFQHRQCKERGFPVVIKEHDSNAP